MATLGSSGDHCDYRHIHPAQNVELRQKTYSNNSVDQQSDVLGLTFNKTVKTLFADAVDNVNYRIIKNFPLYDDHAADELNRITKKEPCR